MAFYSSASGDNIDNSGFLSSIGGLSGLGSGLGSLAGLFGNVQSLGMNNGINSSVQGSLGQNASTTNSQIQALQDQIKQQQQQAQDMYQRSLGDVTTQNAGLQGNIGTMTSNLNALSDPNSPYMQMARKAIEAKDAAAGRNSQWGDRETQLAGTLAQYVSQYAPGLNNSITQAQHQINANNQGLAALYSTANNPADRNEQALIQMLQAQNTNANSQNTIGRQAASAQAGSLNGLLTNGGKVLGGLAGLFGGGSGSGTSGITNYFGNLGGTTNGITGFGNSIGDLYGSTGLGNYGSPVSSMYDNMGMGGYGNLPAADYFGGGGFLGTPTGSYDAYSDY